MWFVYFLELANGDIYFGSTNDLTRRTASHQKRQVPATKTYCPVTLKAYVAVATEAHARRLERYFKSGSGKAFAKKRFLAE
jgi:putative endonuclease